MEGNQMQENSPVVPERSKIFDIIYMLVFVVLLGYCVYVFALNFDNYTEEQLIGMSYYMVPAFFFSVVGLIAVRSTKSIVWALIAAVVSGGLLFAFYKLFWNML